MTLQEFLARLYVDAAFRAAFLADRERVARSANLPPEEIREVVRLDGAALELAAASFAHKRARKSVQRPRER